MFADTSVLFVALKNNYLSLVSRGCCEEIDKRNFRAKPWAWAKDKVKEGAGDKVCRN